MHDWSQTLINMYLKNRTEETNKSDLWKAVALSDNMTKWKEGNFIRNQGLNIWIKGS